MTATVDTATRKLRLQRLIGLTPEKGIRGDLARAEAAIAQGWQTDWKWHNGKPIGEAIATYRTCLAKFESELAALG